MSYGRDPIRAQVVITRCPSAEEASLAVDYIFDNLNEDLLSTILEPGSKILIKPNVVNNMPPSSGVITKPEIVEAVVRKIQSFGAYPILAEGQVHGIKSDGFVTSGLKAVSERTRVPLVDLNKDVAVEVEIEGARVLKRGRVAKTVLECDRIISLPVMKTNLAVLVTLSLKNMVAVLVAFEKHRVHLYGLEGIDACIVDLNRKFRPDLTIMDGIIGMEGDGPTNGRPVHTGVLLGGFDPVAVDSAACQIMGIDPKKVRHLRWAEEEGIGTTHYEIIGESIERVKMNYQLPITYRSKLRRLGLNFLEPYFMWLINRHSRMLIRETMCVGCGICEQACAGGAITMVNEMPVIDHEKCIKCMCCQEACPEGAPELTGWINLRNRLLAKRIFGKEVGD